MNEHQLRETFESHLAAWGHMGKTKRLIAGPDICQKNYIFCEKFGLNNRNEKPNLNRVAKGRIRLFGKSFKKSKPVCWSTLVCLSPLKQEERVETFNFLYWALAGLFRKLFPDECRQLTYGLFLFIFICIL